MLNILDIITDWIKGILRDCIMGNLDGMFDQINSEVGEVAANVGTTPAAWNAGVFSMIRNLSDNVVVPIAGIGCAAEAGTVSLLDLDMKGWFPIFRSEPIPFVREFIEEAQRSEEYTIAEVAAHRQRMEAADEIPVGMELTVDGQRVKIHSVDAEHDVVRLKILDTAYSYLQRPIQAVRDLVSKARAAVLGPEDSVPSPEPGRQEDGQTHGRSTADTISVGAVLTIDGHRMKIDSVDKAGNDVMLLDLDAKDGPPMFVVRPAAYVRRKVAEAQAADPHKEPEQVEIDGGQVVPPPPPASRQPRRERHNFQITDDNLGVGGEKTKYQYNVAAIRTLKQIETECRLATPEEQEQRFQGQRRDRSGVRYYFPAKAGPPRH